MIKSMTGFGKADRELSTGKVLVEVKTLNGKGLDLNLKLPQVFRETEQAIRNRAAAVLVRGKAEILIQTENGNGQNGNFLNRALLEKQFLELKEVSAGLGVQAGETLMAGLLRMPDLFRSQASAPDEADMHCLLEAVEEALEQTDLFRQSEGKRLEEDLNDNIDCIRGLLDQIPALEADRIRMVRERLWKNLNDLGENLHTDANRFEQELIYYLEKLDISEEKVRLAKHLDYFIETMPEEGASGKKLGFISQEIGREINTIGSKANDAAIQKLVVQMKDALEKIKEQLMNIV